MSAALKPVRDAVPLYEHAARLAEIDARIDAWMAEHPDDAAALGGELPPDLAAEWEEAMAGFANKGEAVAQYIGTIEDKVANCRAEERRLATHRGVLSMTYAASVPSESDLFSAIAIQKNPPKTVIAENVRAEDWIDTDAAEFLRVVPERVEFDRLRLLGTWKAGKALPPGVTIVQDTELVIR